MADEHREGLAALRDAADVLERASAKVTRHIAEDLHRGGVLQDDPGSVAASARISQEILRAFLHSVRRGEAAVALEAPPESLAVARALARSGQGLRQLLRLCHLGHGAVLSAFAWALDQLQLDPELRAAAARQAHELSFAWVDAFGGRLSDEYERARDELLRSGEGERGKTIRALIAGDGADPDASGRALGYELSRHHTAFVLWSDGDAGASPVRLASAAREAALQLGAGRPLLLPVARTALWAWVGRDRSTPDQGQEVLRRRNDGISIAVSGSHHGADGFRRAHLDAYDAFRVALAGRRRPGSVVAFESVALAAMLVGDLERTRRFVGRSLGELALDDDDHARLRATLRVFVEQHRSRRATAARLSIHPNTVGNRIQLCEEVLGRDMGGRPADVHLALVLADQLGSSVLQPSLCV